MAHGSRLRAHGSWPRGASAALGPGAQAIMQNSNTRTSRIHVLMPNNIIRIFRANVLMLNNEKKKWPGSMYALVAMP